MLRRLPIAILALFVAIAAMLPSGRVVHCRMGAQAAVAACACAPAAVGVRDLGGPTCVPVEPCCDIVLLPPHPEEQVAEIPCALPVALIVVAVPWLQGPAVAAQRAQPAPVPGWLVADGRGASRARPPCYVRFCTYLI
jgi:hypothetical protein